MSKNGREFDHSHYQTWMDPKELIPYPKNAKQHDKAQVKNIANSIKRFGWQQEAVVTQDNVLVIGHGRRLAALMLKCEMPVKVNDQKADIIVWDKCKAAPQMADNVLNNQFEFVFVFGDNNATRAIPFSKFHGNKNNLISFTPGNNEYADIHRAVFPIRFPIEILGIANKTETVLDVFGGTGTTMMACEQSGKSCFMMELDPRYVDAIIDRWETFTGEKAVLIHDEG